ncbi:unnamed protein product [Camellia sinensis]
MHLSLLCIHWVLFPRNPFSRENMFAYSVVAASIQSHYQPPINNISIPSIPKPKPLPIFLPPITNPKLPPSSSTLKSQFQKGKNPRKPRKIVVAAENGNNEPIADPKEKEKIEKNKDDDGIDNQNKKMNVGDEEERNRRNGRPAFNLRWGDLLLDPDPDNILAVGLTGLLAWASVQVLWQLFFISVAIIVAALNNNIVWETFQG